MGRELWPKKAQNLKSGVSQSRHLTTRDIPRTTRVPFFIMKFFTSLFSFSWMRTGLALAGLTLLAGCGSVPIDEAGDYQAVNEAGNFRMLVNADAARTVEATRKAFQEFRLTERTAEINRFDAAFKTETDLGETVRVNIREVNSRQSEVAIRVKWLGHQDYSKRLWQRIEANLGE
jgi:hypothetical protein